MSELSQEASDALSALREHTATDAQRDRMRARLLSAGIAVGVATVSTTAAASVATASTGAAIASGGVSSVASSAALSTKVAAGTWTAKLIALPVAVKAVAAVGIVGAALLVPRALPATSTPTTPAAAAAKQHEPVHRPATRALAAPPVTVPMNMEATASAETAAPIALAPARQEPLAVAPSAHAPVARKSARTTSAAPASYVPEQPPRDVQSVASVLAAESALLADALRALRSDQWGTARTLLNQHEQKFGAHALLAPERERMRAELAQHAPEDRPR